MYNMHVNWVRLNNNTLDITQHKDEHTEETQIWRTIYWNHGDTHTVPTKLGQQYFREIYIHK